MQKWQYSSLLLLVLSSSCLLSRADDVNAEAEDYYRNEFQVCGDSIIEVQSVSLLCDSPGTYYYGSGKYRDSNTCVPGDKAKVEIEFYIADADTILNAGGYAFVSVDVDGGWFQESRTVYENADMCSLYTMSSESGSTCPFQGYYKISTQFYWDKSNQYYGKSFMPTVSVGFKSAVNKNVYDYGGANTNLCRGSTFVTWQDGAKTKYANAIANFIITFGILLFTITCMAGFIWFLMAKPRSLSDAREKIPFFRRKKTEEFADDEFDFSKMQTAGDRDLVDF